MTCPQNSNVSIKEFHNLSNYKDLQSEITKCGNLKLHLCLLDMLKNNTENLVLISYAYHLSATKIICAEL